MSNLLLPEHISRFIPGFEGLYSATTDGKIISHAREWTFAGFKVKKEERCLTPHEGHSGYLSVLLYKNKTRKRYRVNRLIALTFIPNPKNKPQVNHKDGIKLNNEYTNLEWATSQENILHAWENGFSNFNGVNHYRSRFTEDEVREIYHSNERLIDLTTRYNVDKTTIRRIKTEKTWKHLNK